MMQFAPQASAHQISVLLQFNGSLTLTYQQLETACRIADSDKKEQLECVLVRHCCHCSMSLLLMLRPFVP
jgi:hypothetical protein